MKRVASIFAVAAMTIGLFASCESETNVAENDALYELETEVATDGTSTPTTRRKL